jgi:hypothetical protein
VLAGCGLLVACGAGCELACLWWLLVVPAGGLLARAVACAAMLACVLACCNLLACLLCWACAKNRF